MEKFQLFTVRTDVYIPNSKLNTARSKGHVLILLSNPPKKIDVLTFVLVTDNRGFEQCIPYAWLKPMGAVKVYKKGSLDWLKRKYGK